MLLLTDRDPGHGTYPGALVLCRLHNVLTPSLKGSCEHPGKRVLRAYLSWL